MIPSRHDADVGLELDSYITPDIALIHYYYMEHLNNVGNPCHGQRSVQFKGTRL
jgi:hypothetical protein